MDIDRCCTMYNIVRYHKIFTVFSNIAKYLSILLQGVPENLSHFVFGLLCFIYLLYGFTTPFIWKLTSKGTQRVLKVFWQSNRTGDIFKSNLDFELLKKISPSNYMWGSGGSRKVLEGPGIPEGRKSQPEVSELYGRLLECHGMTWDVFWGCLEALIRSWRR